MKKDPQNLKINQAVFQKDQELFDWKVAREGGDLSGIGQQLEANGKKKITLSLPMDEIIP